MVLGELNTSETCTSALPVFSKEPITLNTVLLQVLEVRADAFKFVAQLTTVGLLESIGKGGTFCFWNMERSHSHFSSAVFLLHELKFCV